MFDKKMISKEKLSDVLVYFPLLIPVVLWFHGLHNLEKMAEADPIPDQGAMVYYFLRAVLGAGFAIVLIIIGLCIKWNLRKSDRTIA